MISHLLLRMKKETLLIIHGLNNNQSLFNPLIEHFGSQGYNVVFITLPCHGDNRYEATTYEEALACFNATMKRFAKKPYSVIAFSLGALYLQLWLKGQKRNLPRKQILLAPALEIHNFNILSRLISKIPSFFRILSIGPKEFSRYNTLTLREYKILFGGLENLYQASVEFKVPTLLLVDPNDELVSAKALQKMSKGKDNLEFKLWKRPYLTWKHGLGRHHLITHPKYFNKRQWNRILKLMNTFLLKV